jgi:hypothetical protein
MEEIHYKKNLEDLTNHQLQYDFENVFLHERLPQEIEDHLEIIFNANPEDRFEPAESRNILFNYMQNRLENEQPVARKRLRGGKKSKRRKSQRRSKKSKRRKSQRRR